MDSTNYKTALTKWLRKNKVSSFIFPILTAILIIFNFGFFMNLKSLESENFYYIDAVPHIELNAAMIFYGTDTYRGKLLTHTNSNNFAFGRITGFVSFPNLDNQPKGAWQYYTITAGDRYDSSGKQIFSLEETLKLHAIPPRSFDAEVLNVVKNDSQSITLKSENGQLFQIDKKTDKVIVIDSDGDISTLITNQQDYKEFMEKFLR